MVPTGYVKTWSRFREHSIGTPERMASGVCPMSRSLWTYSAFVIHSTHSAPDQETQAPHSIRANEEPPARGHRLIQTLSQPLLAFGANLWDEPVYSAVDDRL